MLRAHIYASLLTLAALHAGCSGLQNECNDGIDNDGDGLVDSRDTACQREVSISPAHNCTQTGLSTPNPACDSLGSGVREWDDPACADRIDNDDDGLASKPVSLEVQVETAILYLNMPNPESWQSSRVGGSL